MRPVLILYSSREGQTRKVVGRVIEHLTVHCKEVCVEDVESWSESMSAADYRAVVIAASLHHGQHASEMSSFVSGHRIELARLPTAFLAISLVAASAEPEERDHSQHPRSSAEVAKAIEAFRERTGLTPRRTLPVAGALLYTADGRLERFVLQRIARDGALDRDSGVFEQTSWTRVERFIDEFLSLPPAMPARKMAAAH
jgi:menaquinone-dependent protoporphyrinogen oxidase